MRILLVEDNPVDRDFVTKSIRHVEGFEYELVNCEMLSEALVQIGGSPFDVVLLDLGLPDSQGLETCHRFVAEVRDIPFVVMTAECDRSLATEAMRCGAQDYMVKGAFPGSAIARVLQYAIDRFQFQRDRIQQNNHFQEVLSRVPAIIWTTDLALEIKAAMGAGLQLLGLDPQHIIGKTLKEYFSTTGEAEGAVQAHRRALEGESVAFETEWLSRCFDVKIDPLHEPDGRISGTIGVALDVTERRDLDREIKFARKVQEALLPAEHLVLEGFDIFGGSYSAAQTCGDWFDYLAFPDGSFGLVVGDVSGHGFGPAILSANVAAYLESLAENHSDIQEILNSCNRLVCKRSLNGHFAVLSLARLKAGVKTLTFCGAGEELLIVTRDGHLKQRVPGSGVPIGMLGDAFYDPPAQIALEQGDVLLLLTDGFHEAQNEAGEIFGKSRVVETVAAFSHVSASEIFQGLWQVARKFSDGHRQQDDMTGIIVKVRDS